MRDPLQLFPKLEEMGEAEVRVHLARGTFGVDSRPLIQEWLNGKDSARSVEAATRKETREEESLSISRKALDNSRLATRIAISAIVLSIIMAIYEIIKWYSR